MRLIVKNEVEWKWKILDQNFGDDIPNEFVKHAKYVKTEFLENEDSCYTSTIKKILKKYKDLKYSMNINFYFLNTN